MDIKNSLIDQAKEVLEIEAEGITHLIDRLDENFSQLVELIFKSKGRVIIGGIGKSGIVGQKIVATLNSTGTRAIFLHPVEAMHGDLGLVCKDDIFLALSNSGETDELNTLLPSIRNIGCPVAALTGNADSTLAECSDMVIYVGVEREACPLGLAPTASTTALLAMGDAIAVALINRRDFKSSEFKMFHPGGSLGQRLSRQVGDIMLSGDAVPLVPDGSEMDAVVTVINDVGLGAALIVKDDGFLVGIVTDGDIRRFLAERKDIFTCRVDELMTKNPRALSPETPAYDALYLMEDVEITVLPITDDAGKVKGILHLHDILGKGAFKFNGTR